MNKNVNIKYEIEKYNKENNNENLLSDDEEIINNFIKTLTNMNDFNKITEEEKESVNKSISNIKQALNNEYLNSFDFKSFLKLWINDFLNY